MNNVLIINGHPRKGSFSQAMAEAYAEGASAAGVKLECLAVSDLSFNPNVTHFSPRRQPLEPDISRAQELILWAQHIVFIYPTWWGTMPALLKGFIDRVFTAGFAFEEIEGGTGFAPLLRGKTAQIITTMDTPVLVYKLLYRSPGHNAMRKATLGFCGFNMGTTINLGPVKDSSESTRSEWLGKVKKEGLKLSRGPLSLWTKSVINAGAWLKAIRLQFYPMTCIAYATGALGAASMGYPLQKSIFWLGYLWLFFLEVATVLSNEYYDYKSDVTNKYFSMFNGGSRVIVDNQISFRNIKKGIFLALFLALATVSSVLWLFNGTFNAALLTCTLTALLALGYTVPPLRLSYRGLGELTVGITHSLAVIVCGYIFQGGSITESFPWLLSTPLFLSILPSIILAGIPDYDADKTASKRTLAVRLGKKGAAWLAVTFTLLSAVTVVLFNLFNVLPQAIGILPYVVIPHATLLLILLFRYINNPSPPGRIDGLLIAALTYLTWFALIPLLRLI